ncbi:MAG: hypothetical protein AB1342_10065 [Pseudomonadota bacterium]
MQLGQIIRNFSDETTAGEILMSCNDLVLFTRVAEVADRFGEAVGEYAAGSVRRFANLAGSEDWLGLMNVLERAADPGTGCLAFMVDWSLRQDEVPQVAAAASCTCGSSGSCS